MKKEKKVQTMYTALKIINNTNNQFYLMTCCIKMEMEKILCKIDILNQVIQNINN